MEKSKKASAAGEAKKQTIAEGESERRARERKEERRQHRHSQERRLLEDEVFGVFMESSYASRDRAREMLTCPERAPATLTREEIATAHAASEMLRATIALHDVPDAPQIVQETHRKALGETISLFKALDFDAERLGSALMGNAVLRDCAWACKRVAEALPGSEARPLREGSTNGHWPLTLAVSNARVDAFDALVEAGAGWDDAGRAVLTGVPWDHPEHPFLRDRMERQPWWRAFLGSDARMWEAFANGALEEDLEEMEMRGGWMFRHDSEMHRILREMALSPRASAQFLGFEPGEEPQKPSREVMLAELHLSHVWRHDGPGGEGLVRKLRSRIVKQGLAATETEREAILALQARAGQEYFAMPAGWRPDAGEGRALWALLSRARWMTQQDMSESYRARNKPVGDGGWNWQGEALLAKKEALAKLVAGAATLGGGAGPLASWVSSAQKQAEKQFRETFRSNAAPESIVGQELTRLEKGSAALIAALAEVGWSEPAARDAIDAAAQAIEKLARDAIARLSPGRRAPTAGGSADERRAMEFDLEIPKRLARWADSLAAAAGAGPAPAAETPADEGAQRPKMRL
jgi:hypothetical protein